MTDRPTLLPTLADAATLLAVVEQSPAFIAVLRGPELVFEFANRRYVEVVGNRPLIGRRIRDALPEIEGQGFFERFDEAFRTGLPFTAQEMPALIARGNATNDDGAAGSGLEQRHVNFVLQPLRDAGGAVWGIMVHGVDVTDLARARDACRASEERLRASEERLAFSVQAAELGTFYCPMPLGRIVWNEACKRHFFLPPEAEVDFDLFYERLHPDDRAPTRAAIERALSERVMYDVEYRTRAPDGRTRWIRAVGRGFYDAAGACTRFDGVTIDLERQKRHEAERRELDERHAAQARLFDRTLSSISDSAYTFDRAGRFTFANRPLLAQLGRGLDEVVGRGFADLGYEPDLAARLQRQIGHVLATGERVVDETSFTPPAGGDEGYYQYIFAPVLGADGGVEAVAGSTRDVTAARRAAAALRESELRYRTLFDSVDQGFCIVEVILDAAGRPADYRFVETNPAFVAQTGLRDAVGHTALELVPGLEPFWIEAYGNVALGGAPARFERQAAGLAGRWFEVYAFRFGDAGRRQVAIFFKDVSERKAFEAGRERDALALEAQRSNLAAIVQMAPAFMATLRGPEHVFELANERYYELVGRRDVIGRPARQAVPEAEGQGFFELLDAVYRTGEPFVGNEVPLTLGPEGVPGRDRVRVINFIYQALRGPDGAIDGIFVHGIDVTDLVRARDAVAESEARRRLALDAAELGSWHIDPATNALQTDERFRAIFAGDAAAALDVERAFACIHPDDRAGNRAAVEASIRGEDPPPYAQEYRVVHADGQTRWVYSKGRATLAGRGADRRIVSFDGTVADVTDRKRAEAALVASEQRYRLLAAASADVAYRMSADWSALLPLDGRRLVSSSEQPLGDWRWLHQNIPPDEHPRVRAAIAHAMAGPALFELEHRVRRPDGSTGWTMSRAVPILGPADELSEWFGTASDITDRKRAEEALRANEARFRFLSELGDRTRDLVEPEAVMGEIARALGEHLRVSRCAYAEVDADTEHFTIRHDYTDGVPSTVGSYDLSLFGPRAAADQRAGRTLVIRDVDAELIGPDAGAEMFNAIGIRAIICCPLVRAGRLTAMMAVHHSTPRDWTPDEVALVGQVVERSWAYIERARIARALERSEAEFRLLADAMPQMVWVARPDGFHEYYNRRWYEYTGVPDSSTDGVGWNGMFHPDDQPRAWERWRHSLATGEPYEIEYRLRHRSGEYRWNLGRALPVRNDRGEIERWFGTCTDIHAMRRMADERDALLRSERDARAEAERASKMKDEFLATLSHEIRTPLSAILGWSQILKRGNQKPETLSLGLDTIERNARAQTQIVEDLLDMSRIISGKVALDARRIDLGNVIRAAIETVRPAATAKDIDVRTLYPPDRYPVLGDPNRLQQVFWNLLSNAIKFTPKGGRVDLDLDREQSQWQVRVRDSGEGIAPDFLPYVFDRFRQADASTTRRHGGLGLGLAIVKQLTELHGGRVDVASRGAGTGATFTVALPVSAIHVDPAQAAPHAADAAPADGAAVAMPNDGSPKWDAEICQKMRGVRVLVVDDEPDARGLLEQLLRDCEMTVLTAANAEEALAMLQRERPDVLVSDIGMPGEDGYSLIRRVRALGAAHGGGIPAIALTAYARAEDRVKAVRAGFNLHVPKPVEPAELVTMVASLVAR